MAQTVLAGPYIFFTLAELEAEKLRYKEAVKESGSDLAGGSVNGQSFQFGPRRDWSLVEWGDNLLFAFSQLVPGKYGCPQGNRSTADFRSAGSGVNNAGWWNL